MKYVTYLDVAGGKRDAHEWEYAQHGVIIPIGEASELLIPWHRVLCVWDTRDSIPR